MAWPDNTTPISNAQFQNDSGTVTGSTGARAELNSLIGKLNQALNSIDAGDTPWTDGNDAPLMKTLANGQDNDIGLVNSTGNPIRSGKTISNTVGTTDDTVPTSQGVREYVADNAGGGWTYLGTLAITGTQILGTATIDSTTVAIRLVFHNVNVSSTSTIFVQLGRGTGQYDASVDEVWTLNGTRSSASSQTNTRVCIGLTTSGSLYGDAVIVKNGPYNQYSCVANTAAITDADIIHNVSHHDLSAALTFVRVTSGAGNFQTNSRVAVYTQ